MRTWERFIAGAATLVSSTFAVAVVIGLAMDSMPCRWFGTSFEGACGYTALSVYLVVGIPLSIVLGIISTVLVLRKTAAVAKDRVDAGESGSAGSRNSQND